MSEQSDDGTDQEMGGLHFQFAKRTRFTAVCPHCEREEDFDDQLTARAWMTGHIQKEHSEKLPDYAGDSSE